MMTVEKTIGLIRHGETDWNIQRRMQGRENTPLNETGQRQAVELGLAIAGSDWTWDIIVSSPLARALDTAKTISQHLQAKPIVIRDDLAERDFGQASGLTRAEAKAQFPDGQIPGQESQSELTHRVVQCLNFIFDEIPEQRILLVTHGEVLRTIYRLIGHTHKVSLKPENASLDVVSITRTSLPTLTFSSP